MSTGFSGALDPTGYRMVYGSDGAPIFEQGSACWPWAAGTQVYAQVDSAHAQTSYGAVLENHEITGEAYNNIAGPIASADASSRGAGPLALKAPWPAEDRGLPQAERKRRT